MPRAALWSTLAAILVALVASGGTARAQDEPPPWQETRFWTGCEPGPHTVPGLPDPVIPPPLAPPDPPEGVRLTVHLNVLGEPMLGTGFNMEHALWSCPAARPILRRWILDPFAPAIVRVDSGLLPAAPDELPAEELGWDVYQSVLRSAPYADSWRMLRRLNQAGVKLVVGVWGGPSQFTDNGTRLGTLLPEYYLSYVEYVHAVVDFLVVEQGVQVWAVTIANEPDGGDGNRIPPEGVAEIARELAARVRPYGVQLYGPDTGSAETALEYLPLLLDDPEIADALAFVGFHDYSANPAVADVVRYVRARRPDLPVILTEYTSFQFGDLDDGHEARDHIGFAMDVLATALSHYRYGASAALYWDAVDYLQPGHDAITRWGLLRGPEEDFAPRVWYYAFLQVLPYLGPGSQVAYTGQDGGADVATLAIRQPDGGLAIVIVNQGAGDVSLALDLVGPGASEIPRMTVVRTGRLERAESLGRVALRAGAGRVVLPGRSITTLVALAPE